MKSNKSTRVGETFTRPFVGLKAICSEVSHSLFQFNMVIDINLTAGTKKEEIARFNKAKTDPEFAKMLKVRTLGPEHLETQSQLRRDIRVSSCVLDSHFHT